MFARLLAILCAALLPAAGCGRTDVEQQSVQRAVATRSDALNSRDLPRYLSVVSQRYSDKGKNYAQLSESLERSFKEYEALSYESDRPEISVKGATAESVSSYRIRVRARGKEMTLNGTEHLRLAKEQDGWKIIAGI